MRRIRAVRSTISLSDFQTTTSDLGPTIQEMRRQLELGLEREALETCKGLILGLHGIRGKEGDCCLAWAPDFSENTAEEILREWIGDPKKTGKTRSFPRSFIDQHVPEFALRPYPPELNQAMPKKVKRPTPPIRWEFPRHVPTIDFFEGMDLDGGGDLGEAIENFVSSVEGGTFLTWEAVVSREQGLHLLLDRRGLRGRAAEEPAAGAQKLTTG